MYLVAVKSSTKSAKNPDENVDTNRIWNVINIFTMVLWEIAHRKDFLKFIL